MMIIGNGMIAKAFHRTPYEADDSVLIFASGVSNSGETDPAQFAREEAALAGALQRHRDALVVYFSTCSVDDSEVAGSPYVLHKLKMEDLIAREQTRYLICRLPQVVGTSTNRTTLMNYLYDRIVSGASFTVWKNAVRHLIDVEDVARIVVALVEKPAYHNRILNVSALGYRVEDIVKELEAVAGKKADYRLIEKGTAFAVDTTALRPVLQELHIEFDSSYLLRMLTRYYAPAPRAHSGAGNPAPLKELLSFEWVMFDNCNFKCPYCVNKGEFSHKETSKLIYVPGRELEIARRIVELSRYAKKVDVNLTGGEPLLAKHMKDVLVVLKGAPNIKIHLITNFALIDRAWDQLGDLDSVLISLHINHRNEKSTDKLIDLINAAKKKVPLIISQVDCDLTAEDRQRLDAISRGTGLPINYQPFIPPWTEEGKVNKGKEISDATFVRSAGKRCILGYFNYFLLPDGTFYHGLWCDKRTRKVGNFLAPFEENRDIFFPKDMQRCRTSSCGCNYNTYCFDEYRAECERLGYPRSERFGRYNKRIGFVLRNQTAQVPAMAMRFLKNSFRRLLGK